MGVGEGTNEMPEHLLEELRKRAIYYKSEAPKEIQVLNKLECKLQFFFIYQCFRLVGILCIMEVFVHVKI